MGAIDECGAPVVSIAGGEPLLHREMPKIVKGFLARKKLVILCTNALLLAKKIDDYQPHPSFTWSIHLDGNRAMHDKSVCQQGTYDKAVEAIQLAKSKGFRVSINCTLFNDADAAEVAAFLDDMKALGLDGITVSPGYAYERAPDQKHFLNRNKTKELFRGILARGRGGQAWPFSQSTNFLNFLAGNETYQCTPWGNPTRTVFGWQKPCYLLGEGYAKTFRELMDTTEWDKYGVGKYEKCADCMVHCGFEASAVKDMVRRPLKALGGDAARRAHRRRDGEGHPARRPAAGGFRLLRPCRPEAYRDPGRQVRDPAAGGRGVGRERPSRPPARSGSAPAIATAPSEASAGRPADRRRHPARMPTRAAGGSVRCAASEMTRAADERQAVAPGDAGGDVRFHVDGDGAGGAMQRGLQRRRRRHGIGAQRARRVRRRAGARPAQSVQSGSVGSAASPSCTAVGDHPAAGPQLPAPAHPRCRC